MTAKFEELVQRVLKDEAFRKALQADPTATLHSVGVKATPELLKSLHAVDWAAVHKVGQHYKAAEGIVT